MEKTPKSQLKEMVDKSKGTMNFKMFESDCPASKDGKFEFTCKFTDKKDGKVLEGLY